MKNSEWIKEHLNTIFDDNADKIKKIGAVEEKLGFIKGKLYKYYSFEDEYSLSNLEEDIIHFSKPETFNDPFDCILSFSLERAIDMFYPMLIEKGIVPKIKNSSFKQLVRESFGNKNADIIDTVELIINKSHYFGAEGKKIRAAILEADEKLNEANKENFNMINNIFAISCFSESSDNIVMWSHYANKHTGFCVEYDFNDCDIKDFEIVCRLFPVTYSESRFQLSSNIFGLDNSNRIIFKSNPKAISELMMLFLTKSNIWE